METKIGQLRFEANYSIVVIARNEALNEGNEVVIHLSTPTCLDTYHNISICSKYFKLLFTISKFSIDDNTIHSFIVFFSLIFIYV